jgi:uncharacterized secreted protein with C-terminal beta-propeller domain
MRLRTAIVLLIVMFIGSAPAAAEPRAAKRIHTFGSCSALIGYARAHVPRVVPRPVPMPQRTDLPSAEAAPGAGAVPDDTSQTNVQEAGVDEPDIVKTDGRVIWALEGGRLNAVDARAARPRLLSSLDLSSHAPDALLRSGDRMLVLGSGFRGAHLTQVDVSDPAKPVVMRTEMLEGELVDARLAGRTARIVVESSPDALTALRLRSRASGWVPQRRVVNARTRSVTKRRLSCRTVRRPAVYSGAGVVTVYTVDLAGGLPSVDADAILASAETVYASASSLFVATRRWDAAGGATSIHRFDTSDPRRTAYSATGTVPGELLSQFALSEDRGVLRAASTKGFGDDAESLVTTLADRDGRLVRLGAVGGLGRGERIYAVRFLGDTGYVVTFRQVDPLYTLDLADPARPVVRGELKIPGYSAYLHPVGDDLLLGVGQNATGAGEATGLQLSLFDVSDLARPARLAQVDLGSRYSGSEAEWDHHAFLFWPATGLAVLPIDSEDFSGAAGFTVSRAGGIAALGQIAHAPGGRDAFAPPVRRAVVVGDRLFTISELGAKASTLAGLADAGWVAFPEGARPPDGPIALAP